MSLGLRLGASFNKKLRLGSEGRRDIFHRLGAAIDPGKPLAWFHAASLGEFEQGRPVIEAFRQKCPEHKILVTFFSPSGYEIRKNYQGADYIFYLPIDTPRNARKFIKTVDPDIAVFIKYEFWINYLLALKRNGTKTFIISAIFRPSQPFFKWYGGLMRRALGAFTHIFVQDTASKELLESIMPGRVSVAGDTRFDRVYDIAHTAKAIPSIETFAGNAHVVVAGSTWPPDELLLLRLINDNKNVKFIIAPHEIEPARIERISEHIEESVLRYTQLTEQSDLAGAQVLFIDTIGILSSVYRYGRLAYIGGGFGVGIHNILEAATFGLPLAFGPNYLKFKEARDLIGLGGAVSVGDSDGLQQWFRSMETDPQAFERSHKTCLEYVEAQRGATGLILSEICK